MLFNAAGVLVAAALTAELEGLEGRCLYVMVILEASCDRLSCEDVIFAVSGFFVSCAACLPITGCFDNDETSDKILVGNW